MTAEEVVNFFAPAQSSVDAVIDWLTSSGIERQRISQSANRQVSYILEIRVGYYLVHTHAQS